MSKDLTYTALLSKLTETENQVKFLLSCIERMGSHGQLSTTSKIGIKLPKPYRFEKVEITLDNIDYIRKLSENAYSIKFTDQEFPQRVNESWIALECFKYEEVK